MMKRREKKRKKKEKPGKEKLDASENVCWRKKKNVNIRILPVYYNQGF
jgi:hypothetical protein